MKTMHMKKFLLALSAFLAVGVMSVSCLTQGFEGPEHEIGVRPVSGLATKASSNGPINVNTFDQGRTIFLSAYFNDVNGTNHSQVYFTDIPFTYYSSKWAGGTSGTPNPKYWPHQGTMDFIALSREGSASGWTGLTGISHGGANVATSVTYTMPDNSSNQDDVMMAYAGAQNCAAHEAVPLAFKHAQAQVSVKAKLAAAAYSSNYGITIRSVALRRAKYSGTVTGTASGTNGVTFSWSGVASGTQANVGFGNSLMALSTTEQAYGKGILLPAQSPTGADGTIDIIIEYTLKNGLPASGSTPEERNLSYVYTVPATTWSAGNKYAYVFTFSWNEITCEASVTDWEDGGTTNIPDPSNGHAYVDLGLRSNGKKILFATCNIGAETPTDIGMRFSWGDHLARYSGGETAPVDVFVQANAPFWDATNSVYTKYNDTDGKTELDPEDDIAHILWGGNWRMPTSNEWLALTSPTNFTWTVDESRTVFTIFGKGDYSNNSISFHIYGEQKANRTMDSPGVFWTKTLASSQTYGSCIVYNAMQLGDDVSIMPYVTGKDRYYGIPVRPVLELPE